MKARFISLPVGLVTLAICARQCVASEEKIQPNDLPTKVSDALHARFPDLSISSVAKEVEKDGTIVFDVELKQKDRKYETDIKADGVMLEIEKEVLSQDWPNDLHFLVETNYPKAKITEVMEVNRVVNKDEIPDHLELTLETADSKSVEVLTSIDGKAIRNDESAESTQPPGEVHVDPQDLPEAIVDALEKSFPKAVITNAEKGEESGKQVYEVTIQSDKHSIDVTLNPKGEILSFEKLLSESERPAALARAVDTKYPHATIERVEEVWEEGKLTGYEAAIVTADKQKMDVDLDPQGKMIDGKQ
jgi:uncharacterized membrane protein YkoI